MQLRLLEQLLGVYRDETNSALERSLSPSRLFAGHTLQSHWSDLEMAIGLLMARMFAGSVLMAGGMLVFFATMRGTKLHTPTFWIYTTAWLILCSLEIRLAGLLPRILDMPEPRPVHLALTQKHLAGHRRLLLGLWWLLHASAMIFMADLMGRQVHPQSPNVPDWFGPMIDNLFVFGFAYASNIFIVLGAGALYANERFLRGLWQMRLLVDVLLAIGMPPLLHLFSS